MQNRFNQCFVDAVRATGGKNYYRNLIIQTYATNPDYAFDGLLFPTDVVDKRMAIEFHYYRPAGFSYMDLQIIQRLYIIGGRTIFSIIQLYQENRKTM